ncbi:mediator of RNA polymerase II transcription subunit 24 [Pararge aegeria]|uniref:Mediator of RNA polymerase II transcription subunit 24 n=4 Tax=Pararge aegeria TaxID=116150 RepID=A0A8S4RN18_9NEOP|nr:mediator of RNA polymerase II transcription subunit 24 [Pararge aegeria]CAH2239466.1 jg21474 [Pararge aegeria aegeria]
MDPSKITSKSSSLKALILKAWRERWTDIQWGINIKTILPRGVSGDLYNLADCILQQAMVGCGANQLVISYLKHSLASHLVSYAAVLQRIAKFDAFHKPHCILSLLEFLESFLDSITCRSKMEEEILAFAVSSIILWLLQVYHYSLSKYPATNPIQSQELLEKSTSLLNSIVSSDFLLAMFYLAKQHDPDEYNEVTKKCQEITAFMMMNTQFKAPVTIHDTLQKICSMDIDKIAPLNNKPETVTHCLQAIIAVTVLANPSADMQQLSSQLIMLQRVKSYPLSRLYSEVIRGCFICLNDASKDASKQALWAAFTFLKLPQLITYIHNMCGTVNKDGEYSVEVVEAFEKLLQSTPLLDVVDAKNSCNSVVSLVEPLVKLNVVSESHLSYFKQKRESKDVKLQKLEPSGLQGSVPSFITRAEPTLAGILKTMGGDSHKTQESLYAMLCQIVGGTTLDTILAVATVEGKLKLFVSRLIKFNEFALLAASEKGASQSKVYIFDISFLILCSIVQDYGAEAVLDENGDSFFEQWVRECMAHKGAHKSPDQILQKCDLQLVDIFIHHLSAPDFDFKNTNLKPHDLCVNVSGVVKEILFAWEQGSITAADVKRMLDSLRQKMASLAVCASVWLCSYINVVHQDAFLKPLNMVQQFLTPPTDVEMAQIDNFKERAVLMCQIIRKMQFDIQPPSIPKCKIMPFSHSIISRQPILEQLQTVWEDIKTRGYLHIDATAIVESLLNTAGPVWFVTNLLKETLKFRYQDDLDRSVDIVLAMFYFDIEKCTEALLLHVLPQYLYNAKLCEELVEPQSAVLAKLTVYSVYAALENCISNRVHTSRKRRHDDSEDIEMSASSKLRRLNDNSSDSSLYYAQGQSSSIIIKEPLNSALEMLYKSFSQLAGKNGEVTPQTQFIFEFLVYVVQCGQERGQVVLQKMPSEIVSTLIKALPDNFNIGLILRLYDLSSPYGRKDTARDLCLLRNMRLRPE